MRVFLISEGFTAQLRGTLTSCESLTARITTCSSCRLKRQSHGCVAIYIVLHTVEI